MADAISVSGPISGTDRTLSFETGKLAQLADGAVVARIGDTVLLATATAARSVREGTDFFPLTVDIEERTYAAGKIPGSFFRREGKSSDQAILTCRLIDRPLRPSFPERLPQRGPRRRHHLRRRPGEPPRRARHQRVPRPRSCSRASPSTARSAPSGWPTRTDGTWIPHPTYQEGDASTFELVVAGRALDRDRRRRDRHHDGRGRRDRALVGLLRGRRAQGDRGGAGRRPRGGQDLDPRVDPTCSASWWPAWSRPRARSRPSSSRPSPTTATTCGPGSRRSAPTSSPRPTWSPPRPSATPRSTRPARRSRPHWPTSSPSGAGEIKAAIRSLTKKLVRKRIVEDGVRIDGRGTADIRPLSAEVDLFPTAHGSALFQRGETQVLNVTTLGMPRMNQLLDTITPVDSKRYMHHYNFPPFSTGETGFMRGPKRREIGHGLLAERALLPVVPSAEEFPYTLRLVSDVLASNGSTSMASVCGSTLSLMAAGVPIKAPVAGIAMGLVYDGGTYVTLTDILGAEDAFGDMDFKVAGTADAVTALQLDTKIDGLPADVLAKALLQAKEARLDDPRGHGRRHRRAARPGGQQRPEDRLHGDPDRQDRRGHRAQGQGHQHPAAGDGRRHRRRRRRHGRHGHHRRQGRQRGGGGPAAHLADPRPADGRGRRGLRRQGGQHHQVRRLRQRPARPRRPAAHLEAVALAGGKRVNNVEDVLTLGPADRGPGGRHRPAGQGVAVAGPVPAGSDGGPRATVAVVAAADRGDRRP